MHMCVCVCACAYTHARAYIIYKYSLFCSKCTNKGNSPYKNNNLALVRFLVQEKASVPKRPSKPYAALGTFSISAILPNPSKNLIG